MTQLYGAPGVPSWNVLVQSYDLFNDTAEWSTSGHSRKVCLCRVMTSSMTQLYGAPGGTLVKCICVELWPLQWHSWMEYQGAPSWFVFEQSYDLFNDTAEWSTRGHSREVCLSRAMTSSMTQLNGVPGGTLVKCVYAEPWPLQWQLYGAPGGTLVNCVCVELWPLQWHSWMEYQGAPSWFVFEQSYDLFNDTAEWSTRGHPREMCLCRAMTSSVTQLNGVPGGTLMKCACAELWPLQWHSWMEYQGAPSWSVFAQGYDLFSKKKS